LPNFGRRVFLLEESNLKKYQFHALANIFPLADHGPEFEALVEDIRRNGLRQPIVLHEGMILDGRRRYFACKKVGVSPNFEAWNEIGRPIDFVISTNAVRRHLSPSQLAVAALKSLPFFQKASKDRQRWSKGRAKKVAQPCATLNGKAAEWVAKRFGVSVRMVEMAKAVQKARPKMVAEIDAGRMSVNEAYETIAERHPSDHDVPGSGNDCEWETPQWLFDVLDNEFDFALDACATPEVAKCKRYFTPKQDGLKQRWSKASGGKAIFCNPPYARDQIGTWVKKGYEESQRGATVVMLLPQYVSYAWFRYIVSAYAEIRQVQGLVSFKGFGTNSGKGAGVTPSRNFDVVAAIFRPGQNRSWSGPYVDKPGRAPPAPPKLLALNDSAHQLSTGLLSAPANGRPSLSSKRNDYATPSHALDILVAHLPKHKVIWEGAWGKGRLAGHLKQAGYQVVGGPQMDFFQKMPSGWDILVTNPPFDRKDEFLERAYALGKPFAMLLPLTGLEGKARHALYRKHGVEVIIPDKYINFENDHRRDDHCPFSTAWFCWKLNLPAQLNFVRATW
jgi:phage N-6-adenine-methyltransferase